MGMDQGDWIPEKDGPASFPKRSINSLEILMRIDDVLIRCISIPLRSDEKNDDLGEGPTTGNRHRMQYGPVTSSSLFPSLEE
jgi:hypothetical protein